MRVIAILFVVALVALPFAACGTGGSSHDCLGSCEVCSSNTLCCDGLACNIDTSDGFPRCESFILQCKLGN
jgi:hypothetical protein